MKAKLLGKALVGRVVVDADYDPNYEGYLTIRFDDDSVLSVSAEGDDMTAIVINFNGKDVI